jgi:hypothetical protein
MARTTYTEAEYLGQDAFYFSESQQEKVPIEEMAPQYALNAYRKLIQRFGCGAASSELCIALARKITPGTGGLGVMLDEYGRARIYPVGISQSGARARLRRAGAERTHKEGDWIVGEKDVDMQVTVRKVKH